MFMRVNDTCFSNLKNVFFIIFLVSRQSYLYEMKWMDFNTSTDLKEHVRIGQTVSSQNKNGMQITNLYNNHRENREFDITY